MALDNNAAGWTKRMEDQNESSIDEARHAEEPVGLLWRLGVVGTPSKSK